MEYGKGIEVDESGEDIIIRFSKRGRYGLSKTGKTLIVASTSGNITLDCGVTIGVNAYIKADKE